MLVWENVFACEISAAHSWKHLDVDNRNKAKWDCITWLQKGKGKCKPSIAEQWKKKTNTTYLNNQHIIRDIATCLLYVGIRCGCIETKAIYNVYVSTTCLMTPADWESCTKMQPSTGKCDVQRRVRCQKTSINFQKFLNFFLTHATFVRAEDSSENTRRKGLNEWERTVSFRLTYQLLFCLNELISQGLTELAI